ncbi:MAG: hypothetical protein ACOYMN_11850 [Roseimicrobium sp.]
MRTPFLLVLSTAVAVLAGCATPAVKEMRTGRDAFRRAWHDAEDSNWEVCAMNLATSLQHMKEGVGVEPVRQTESGRVDLSPYLKAMESGPWPKLQAAVRQHDMEQFQQAYVGAVNACATCHTAAGRPTLCLRLPEDCLVQP